MTREEFMDIVYFELHSDGDNYRANRIIDAADEYAEDSNSENPNKWISVSERLPEALQAVLVTSANGHVYISYIVHGEFEYGGDVIAWMPLPEPYGGDKA